eukprot:1177435-Prorocentrum_minimum.AAC.1
MQEAWIYSRNGPIRRRKPGYIPTPDQSDAGRADAFCKYGCYQPSTDEYRLGVGSLQLQTETPRHIASFYGSSCGNNGEGALNTPETLTKTPRNKARGRFVRYTHPRGGHEALEVGGGRVELGHQPGAVELRLHLPAVEGGEAEAARLCEQHGAADHEEALGAGGHLLHRLGAKLLADVLP